MTNTVIKYKKLNDNAIAPVRKHPSDAGADLAAIEAVDIGPGERVLVGTGIAIQLPDNMLGYVTPRSGLAVKKGVTIVNAPGLIDTGYTGEIKVCLLNAGLNVVHLNPGDRIAQLVVQKYEPTVFSEVDSLESTDRGEAGFGSTGVASHHS